MWKNRPASAHTVLSETKPRRGQHRAAGFSLLEVLIAFTILAGVLGTVYGIYADGLRRTVKTEAVAEATVRAENFLARLGADLPLKDAEGTFPDGGHWQITATPRSVDNTGSSQSLILYDVKISIKSATGSTVSMASIRLGKSR